MKPLPHKTMTLAELDAYLAERRNPKPAPVVEKPNPRKRILGLIVLVILFAIAFWPGRVQPAGTNWFGDISWGGAFFHLFFGFVIWVVPVTIWRFIVAFRDELKRVVEEQK